MRGDSCLRFSKKPWHISPLCGLYLCIVCLVSSQAFGALHRVAVPWPCLFKFMWKRLWWEARKHLRLQMLIWSTAWPSFLSLLQCIICCSASILWVFMQLNVNSTHVGLCELDDFYWNTKLVTCAHDSLIASWMRLYAWSTERGTSTLELLHYDNLNWTRSHNPVQIPLLEIVNELGRVQASPAWTL